MNNLQDGIYAVNLFANPITAVVEDGKLQSYKIGALEVNTKVNGHERLFSMVADVVAKIKPSQPLPIRNDNLELSL